MNYQIKIYTLGEFKILINQTDITEKLDNINYGKELLQFLLTFSDRKVSQEELRSTIRNNNEIDVDIIINEINKLFKTTLNDLNIKLIYNDATYYYLNKDINYWKDSKELKSACFKTNRYLEDNLSKAIENFKRALSLYNGRYLENSDSEEWLWHARNDFQSILINTFFKLARQLKSKKKIDILIDFYEQIYRLIKYDEDLIISYLRLLDEQRGSEIAKEKYREIKNMFNSEGLIIPETIENYKSIEKVKSFNNPIEYFSNINLLSKKEGAFYFKPKEFLKLYKLEKMKSERDNSYRCLVHFTLGNIDEQKSKNLEIFNNKFKEHLMKELRGGDVITCWKKNHYLAILANITGIDAQTVSKRLVDSFKVNYEFNKELEINVLEIPEE